MKQKMGSFSFFKSTGFALGPHIHMNHHRNMEQWTIGSFCVLSSVNNKARGNKLFSTTCPDFLLEETTARCSRTAETFPRVVMKHE
jgi:hypothetical protein